MSEFFKTGWAGLRPWERFLVVAAILPGGVGVLNLFVGNELIGAALFLGIVAAVLGMLRQGSDRYKNRME